MKSSTSSFAFFLCVLALSFLSCKDENANAYGGAGALPTNYIFILDNGFSPSSLRIANGSSVTFVNNSNSTHTIISTDSSTLVTTPIAPAHSFIYKKYFVGVINYHCVEYPTDIGSIEFTP